MGSSKNLRVFNFAILLKSQKFDAREIYVCFTVCWQTYVMLDIKWKLNLYIFWCQESMTRVSQGVESQVKSRVTDIE